MKHLLRKSLVLFSLTFCHPSLWAAEGMIGNGGDLVVCENGKPFSHRLLDLYEAHVFNPEIEFDFGADDLDLDQRVEHLIERLARLDLDRANLYRTYYRFFFEETLFVYESLEDLPDSNHLTLPKDCDIHQIAIQLGQDFNIPGKRYLIDKELWDKISVQDQASLVLHELIYRDGIRNGHVNSISTRAFVAFLASTDFEKTSQEEYDLFLKENSFLDLELYPGLKIDKSQPIEYFSKGLIRSAHFLPGSTLRILGEERVLSVHNSVKIAFKDSGEVEFIGLSGSDQMIFEVGGNRLEAFSLLFRQENKIKLAVANSTIQFLGTEFQLGKRGSQEPGHEVSLHQDGKLAGARVLAKNLNLNHKGQSLSIRDDRGAWIDLYDANTLRAAPVKDGTEFQVSSGSVQFAFGVRPGSVIFHPNGRVKTIGLREYSGLVNGQKIYLSEGAVHFNPQGQIVAGKSAVDFRAYRGNGEEVLVLGGLGTNFRLFPDQTVSSAYVNRLVDRTIGSYSVRCHEVEFYPDGAYKTCLPHPHVRDIELEIFGEKRKLRRFALNFYPNQQIETIWPLSSDSEYPVQNKKRKLRKLRFYESGKIEMVKFEQDESVVTTTGESLLVKAGDEAWFDEAGYLTHVVDLYPENDY